MSSSPDSAPHAPAGVSRKKSLLAGRIAHMNKYPAVIFLIAMALGAPLSAQEDPMKLFEQIDSMGETPSPTPAPVVKGNPSPEQEPTIITATEKATFDGPTKVAVLYGDVKVKSPQFKLSADKLTVYFKKDTPASPKDPTKNPAASPPASRPHATPSPKPPTLAPAASQGGDIDKVIAEGNVLIETDRADNNGGPPTHYSGKADKVVYTPATGEAVLTGMPQLQQGMNTMEAADNSTVISLSRDGNMDAKGPVKMNIQNPGPAGATPVPDKTPEAQ